MAYTYQQVLEIAESARYPFNGKPLANNTRVIDLDTHVAIRHHNTDILRFYRDGSLEVHTSWTSMSTIARIREYGGLHIQSVRLPSVNGRRPSRNRIKCLVADVVVPFTGVNGYIRLDPEGRIDLKTVAPCEVEIITDPVRVSRVRLKAKKIYQQIKLRERLNSTGNVNTNAWAWLRSKIDLPLNEIDYSDMPEPRSVTESLFFFARWTEAVSTFSFKTLEDFSRLDVKSSVAI